MKSLALLLAAGLPLAAHDLISTRLTWTVEISRLVNRHCLPCHGEDSAVPLKTYEQSRPWAKAIRDQVMRREMPPWGAVPGFGPRLLHDPGLTQSEIETIVRWVEGGAPKGDEIWLPSDVSVPPVPSSRLPGALLRIGCAWTAPLPIELRGLRPEGLEPGRTMRITLRLPGGLVVPVIWIREYPKTDGPDFVFLKPLGLSKGARIQVQTDAGAVAALAIEPLNAWLRPPGITNPKRRRSCPAP